MKKIILLLSLTILIFTFTLKGEVNARLFQYPDVSETHITFVYGGDIWVVKKAGGMAMKLSSPKGQESFPKFSNDGKFIAFSGNYDGNTDIYIVPAMGGLPKRITHHGMPERMLDWYPKDDSLLFASSMYSERQRYSQFFKVSRNGGLPEKLVIPYGELGSISKDEKKLAYTKRSRLFRTWKRYRGGMAADIWIYDLKANKTKNITNNVANDELPMWHMDSIYYLSDQGKNKRFNIWLYNNKTEKSKQITHFSKYDVHFPSIGPKDLVFEAEGKLFLLNLKTNKYKEIKVDVVTDLAALKSVSKNVSKNISYASASPDAKRIMIEARGEIFSVPAENGFVKNLSKNSGSAERYPSWSPNGRLLAWWSDKTGEYQLTIYDKKTEKTETLTKYKNGYRYKIYWSPDNKKIIFIDQSMTIRLFDLKSKETSKIDQGLWMMEGGLRGFNCKWSEDSNWITYSRGLENRKGAIFLYDLKNNKKHQVTSGYYSDSNPTFDPDGKYLYFLTNRSFRPVYSDMEGAWIYPNSTGIGVITLRKDIKSPLHPRNDEVKIETEKKDKKKDKDSKKTGKDKKKAKKKTPLKIDIDGFERRLIILPVKAGNIGNLTAVSGKVIFHRFPNSGSGGKISPIKYFDLKTRKEMGLISNANGYALVANKKNLLVFSKGSLYIVKIAPKQKLKKSVNTKGLKMNIDPVSEWIQILRDAWRIERDMFYDPNMHGLNWKKVYSQYSKLIKYAVSRDDVNFILGEMIGELNASHSYRGGGDIVRGKRLNVGYLGVDWEKHNKHYKIKKIIKGADWDNEVRSPFDLTGIKVKEGDYILAVNGVEMDTSKDPYFYFQGLANKTIELTINNKPVFKGSKKIIIKTLKNETRLRHLSWIEMNRKRVEKATDGKIGYIYVQSTGIMGQNELVRQFYAQYNKEGLIIDERFNSGGQIPDRFVELLNRKPLAYWKVRDGRTWQHPTIANYGPKVMLINGWSGSGGDAFPDYFRKLKLGPLIGTRTWGGLIGISGAPRLIDGGMVTVPTFRMYDPNGGWFKEGYGVDPDIEVIDDAVQLANGIDPQLEAGIKEVLKLLKKHPPVKRKDPSYEKRL